MRGFIGTAQIPGSSTAFEIQDQWKEMTCPSGLLSQAPDHNREELLHAWQSKPESGGRYAIVQIAHYFPPLF